MTDKPNLSGFDKFAKEFPYDKTSKRVRELRKTDGTFNLSDKIQPILSHEEPAKSLTAIRTEDVKEFIRRLNEYFYHPKEREFISHLAGKNLSGDGE